MTNQNLDEFDDDDAMLHDALEPLREVTPSDHLYDKCIRAVSDKRAMKPRSNSPSRSFNRFALAVTASLLLGTAIGWTLRGSANDLADANPTDHQRESAEAILLDVAPPSIAVTASSVATKSKPKEEPSFYAEQLYLCGVGTIHSNSGYQFLEDEK
jgi:anti-sigma factor RsiW